MSGSIRLSEKHGVNPSLMLCFFCGKETGVALLGRLPNDAEAPRAAVYDQVPCDECREWMRQGVIVIGVDEAKTTDRANPYRTGRWAVLTDDAITRMFTADVVPSMLRQRVAFITDDAWDAIGIPVEGA